MRQRARELLLLLGLGVCSLLLSLVWLWPARAPRIVPLKMTAGDVTGLRHKLALELADEAARLGIQIEVLPTGGSDLAIQGLAGGKFDLAFVQGGLANERASSVRQVSAMHIEPLHLLVKPDLSLEIEEAGLEALSGKTVNLGPTGSGTNLLAAAVLTFVGLQPKSPTVTEGFEPRVLGYGDLMKLEATDLPDAIFMVSSLPSSVADFLIEQREYQLVSLAFGEALALEAFLQLGDPISVGSIDKRHLFETHIPAFTYSVSPAAPPTSLTTIGTRLLLIANDRVPSEVVVRLLDLLYDSEFARAERPPLEASLLDLPPEFPMHPGAEKYRQRNKPLIAGDAIDYWEKIIAITATAAGGTFFMIQWYLGRSRRNRAASIASYMERVLAIENASMQTELSAELDLAALIRLQLELAKIKSEVVRKFAAGELEGEGLIQGFLELVNDARSQVTQLILHQRENIEQQAAQEPLAAGKLWNEQSRIDEVQ